MIASLGPFGIKLGDCRALLVRVLFAPKMFSAATL
jgi:hypothetical protein